MTHRGKTSFEEAGEAYEGEVCNPSQLVPPEAFDAWLRYEIMMENKYRPGRSSSARPRATFHIADNVLGSYHRSHEEFLKILVLFEGRNKSHSTW